jgi:hypothetical protein
MQEREYQPNPTRCPYVQLGHSIAQCCDRANNFMTRNKWVRSRPPLIVEHTQVTVTNPAVLNINFHLFIAQGTGFVLEGF